MSFFQAPCHVLICLVARPCLSGQYLWSGSLASFPAPYEARKPGNEAKLSQVRGSCAGNAYEL